MTKAEQERYLIIDRIGDILAVRGAGIDRDLDICSILS